MTYSCPRCGKNYSTKLNDTWLIVCDKCPSKVFGSAALPDSYFTMVDDWSAIQIGTTGKYKDKSFEVTGRIRLQMKADYRNLWCATYGDKTLWISQSLESIGFFTTSFEKYPIEFYRPNAGMYIEFSDRVKLKCETVEPCISIRYEGEVARFPYPMGNFILIQASNSSGNTVLVCRKDDLDLQFLWGELKLLNTISFERIREFNEWK